MPFDPDAVREFERVGWNRAAGGYEASFATATRQFIEPLLDAAGIGTGATVLDLCCGPGFVGAAAAARGAGVTGLDFSPAMLAEARARFPTIAFHHGDAEAPPFDDACFDAVVSNFGIHHVPRPALALAEVQRILRPGGRFAFTIWAGHDENIAWKLVFDAVDRHGDPRASSAPAPGGGFATADCLRALEEAGFRPRPARDLVRGHLAAPRRRGTAARAAGRDRPDGGDAGGPTGQRDAGDPGRSRVRNDPVARRWRYFGADRVRHRGGGQALIPGHRGRPNRRRIAGGFAASVLLHAIVIGALCLRLDWKRESDMLPPPATVSMVFEGGRPEGPTTPEPNAGAPMPPQHRRAAGPLGGPPSRHHRRPPPSTRRRPRRRNQVATETSPNGRAGPSRRKAPHARPTPRRRLPFPQQPPAPPPPTGPARDRRAATAASARPRYRHPEPKPETPPPVRQSPPERHPSDFPAPMQFSFGAPAADARGGHPGKAGAIARSVETRTRRCVAVLDGHQFRGWARLAQRTERMDSRAFLLPEAGGGAGSARTRQRFW